MTVYWGPDKVRPRAIPFNGDSPGKRNLGGIFCKTRDIGTGMWGVSGGIPVPYQTPGHPEYTVYFL